MSKHSKTTSGIQNGANSLENNQSSNENKRKRISDQQATNKQATNNKKIASSDIELTAQLFKECTSTVKDLWIAYVRQEDAPSESDLKMYSREWLSFVKKKPD